MSRIAFILMAVALASSLASCTVENKKDSSNARMMFPKTTTAFDTNSSFGNIVVSGEVKIPLRNENSVGQLVQLIDEKQFNTSSKQFFFIDVVSSQDDVTSKLIALIEESLRQKIINYEIKTVSRAANSSVEEEFIKLISIQIEPRDCSPGSAPPLETVGGYYEAKFGCAFANNIGFMLDSPRDALKPRTSGVVDAQRTMKILRAYIDGTATGAALPTTEAGEASAVTPAN